MIELKPGQYTLGRDLIEELGFHLAFRALVNGDSPGEIYLDDLETPRSSFAMTMKRCFLVGISDNQAFNQAIKQLLVEKIFPRKIEKGEQGFSLFYAPGDWGKVISEDILDDIYPQDLHHYYSCNKLTRSCRDILPAGYKLVEVDEDLVRSQGMEYHADLIEEIHSECSSVEEFLDNRFGYCVVQGNQIITWCLSEYNSGGGCEVGIATHPDHRRKGLATAAALALIEKALGMDYHNVGWHCYAGNPGSIATALAAGFTLVSEYPAYWVSYDRAIAMGVRGYQYLERNSYQEAIGWFLRAIKEGGAPDWIYWNTACAYAHLEDKESAFDFLHQAIDQGFKDADHIQTSRHFEKWHETEEWRVLILRLQD